MTDPNQVFLDFATQVADEFPSLAAILTQAKEGDLSEQDALRSLSEAVMGDPKLASEFRRVAFEALAPLRDDPKHQPVDHGGLMMHKKRGLPMLNPLIEGAIIERLQFDHDIPEMRTGDLLQGISPAVSVDTDVRDPVSLGLMMKAASDVVAAKHAEVAPARRELVEAALNSDTLALVRATGLNAADARDIVLSGRSSALDPPEYRRGTVPPPVRIAAPSGSTLIAMTPKERRQGAWRFLSTTQGRRSAVQQITELIHLGLKKDGIEVTVRDFNVETHVEILAHHEWTICIDGPHAMHPAFNLIEIAALSIAKSLAQQAGSLRVPAILEVSPVNTINTRSVGWAGRLCSTDSGQ